MIFRNLFNLSFAKKLSTSKSNIADTIKGMIFLCFCQTVHEFSTNKRMAEHKFEYS
jgi:hypothetical protein